MFVFCESTGIYVNARQHVRPRRYQRRFKKARLAQEEDDQPPDLGLSKSTKESSPKEVFSSPVQEEKMVHDVDTLEEDDSEDHVQREETIHHVNPVGKEITLDENDETNCAEYQTDGPLDSPSIKCSHENELIHFIKQQESTLLDTLLTDLDFDLDKNTTKEDDIEEEITLNREERDDAYDAPVQPGHWLTLKTSVLLIWIFAMTHSLTSSQLTDLLTLINLHLLPSNPAFESLYRFKTFFSNLEMPARKHFHCAHCYTSVHHEQHLCPNPVCNRDLTNSNGKEYFLELDIISQLKNFYSRQEFEEGIKHKFSRNKRKKDNIEDIYDSE